ncbi:efhand_3 domain-containing protein/EF_hand_3 domain-containing protein [Cephalotus follicularis]|uniref:Efhand_3 domain-containing protein/EF_hand_3 domain-containing protein n=1 Tax=Cephalotus follicularis TaxID=3775 RepID=A0A1Q3CMZ5_CEPFO|nr:efhand_3 domain-containing protein/EF_hand_3 domain-containing protein [Cephalotus follicularis]
MDLFDAYFRRADLDGDGQISGAEAVAFFQGSNLPKQILAQVWMHADHKKAGFLGRTDFYNALKLVTVAQSKRELTPDMVKAALYGPISAKIPAPQINLAATPAPPSRGSAPAPQLPNSGVVSTQSQNVGIRPQQHGFGNATANQPYFPPPNNQFTTPPTLPPQGIPAGSNLPQQEVQGIPRGATMVAPRSLSSNVSTDWFNGSTGTSHVANRGASPSAIQDGYGVSESVLTPLVQPRPPATIMQTPSMPVKLDQSATHDSKALVVSGNGFPSDSLFGDVFSATPSQPKQNIPSASTAIVPATSGPQPSVRPPLDPLQSTFSQQPAGVQYEQGQQLGRQNQQVAAQGTVPATSTGFPVGAGNSASNQSTQLEQPWPRMTQLDFQKYAKVFVQVDTDRDGKISGEQARNLFLSWRLPREVLKQVWDLSDQDNDSMLSMREFCTALYLMERFREGRSLPTVLPSNIMPDETLLSATREPTAPYGGVTGGPAFVLQQPQVTSGSRSTPYAAARKPPRPHPVPHADGTMLPNQQKPKVPELENHLLNQLSKEEQDSLNIKLQEAIEADKKVEELEKEILDSKQKIEFFHAKMQELIFYKSRCDNRFNEITERVSADKREVEILARKYEEKYRQTGDVASKLTIEEATFRDIQERKMELYQAIVKMEQGDTADGALKERVDHILSGLEELVKTVNERCKQYGLRAKPTTLLELPFGWQPGIQEGAADWDEDWDKFEDAGFTFVKDLTLEVQNVIAPPKTKSESIQKEASASADLNDFSSNANAKSEKAPSTGEQTHENEFTPSTDERITENDSHAPMKDRSPRSPSGGPAGKGFTESQSQEIQDSQFRSVGADGSPHAKDSPRSASDQGGAESLFSGDKGFDEPNSGTFDTHYDTESVWGNDAASTKDTDHERHDEISSFGLDGFGLKPIRTEPFQTDNIFQGKSPAFRSSIFADSVPSTPAYNFSVPSTPAYNFGNSPRMFSGGPENQSFDSFSRFDSINMHDSGFNQSPRHSFTRFDSLRSTSDFDPNGFSSRFDSFNPNDAGFFQSPKNSISRFDSVRTPRDSDHSQGFDSLAKFDSFRSTRDSDHNHGFASFDDSDPFGSTGPFRTSLESQTPRKGSDNWNAF